MVLHSIIQTIFVAAGVTALLAAAFNWEWFFASKNAEPVVKRIGRNRSRLLYGAVGAVLIATAVFFYYKVQEIM